MFWEIADNTFNSITVIAFSIHDMMAEDLDFEVAIRGKYLLSSILKRCYRSAILKLL